MTTNAIRQHMLDFVSIQVAARKTFSHRVQVTAGETDFPACLMVLRDDQNAALIQLSAYHSRTIGRVLWNALAMLPAADGDGLMFAYDASHEDRHALVAFGSTPDEQLALVTEYTQDADLNLHFSQPEWVEDPNTVHGEVVAELREVFTLVQEHPELKELQAGRLAMELTHEGYLVALGVDGVLCPFMDDKMLNSVAPPPPNATEPQEVFWDEPKEETDA